MPRSPPRPPGTITLLDGITIREARPEDQAVLIDLLRELQTFERSFNPRLKPPEEIGEWYIDMLTRQCAKLEGVILVAEDASGVLGCAVVYLWIEDTGEEEMLPHVHAHVSELVVTRRVRGKGLGKLLLTECERRARFAGRDEISLAVEACNDHAHRLYRDAGYHDAKIRMSKSLS
jgi:ribosomal protein S18 acetylase RimI-like enzyme